MAEEMKNEIMEETATEKEPETSGGVFDDVKKIEGVDTDLVDRASALMSDEEPEDVVAYKTELKAVIDELKTAKEAAKNTNAIEVADAFDGIVKQLEEFSKTLGDLEEDVTAFGGKKMSMLGK